MASITGKIVNGNCQPVENAHGVYDVWPQVEKSYARSGETNLWYRFYAEITGKKGEAVTIRLNWPHYERYYIDGGYGNGGENNDPFSYLAAPYHTVIPDIVYVSADQIHWNRLDRSQTGFDLTQEMILIHLVLEETRMYLSVGFPYTRVMLDRLHEDLLGLECIQYTPLGPDIGGEIVPMYTCTDFSVPVEQKKAIWYQAAQHCDETIGSNLADAMLRFLVSPEAEPIRKRYIFHIVPVVAVWNWMQGRGRHFLANPNRDWQDFVLPETTSLAQTIRSLLDSGENITLTLDAHTGVHTDPPSVGFCAAGFWIDDDNGDVLKQEGTRLANCLMEHADFPPTCVFYVKKEKFRQPGKFNTYVASLGIARNHTLELGRVCGYDRKEGKAVPYTNDKITRWGAEFTKAICGYLDQD